MKKRFISAVGLLAAAALSCGDDAKPNVRVGGRSGTAGAGGKAGSAGATAGAGASGTAGGGTTGGAGAGGGGAAGSGTAGGGVAGGGSGGSAGSVDAGGSGGVVDAGVEIDAARPGRDPDAGPRGYQWDFEDGLDNWGLLEVPPASDPDGGRPYYEAAWTTEKAFSGTHAIKITINESRAGDHLFVGLCCGARDRLGLIYPGYHFKLHVFMPAEAEAKLGYYQLYVIGGGAQTLQNKFVTPLRFGEWTEYDMVAGDEWAGKPDLGMQFTLEINFDQPWPGGTFYIDAADIGPPD